MTFKFGDWLLQQIAAIIPDERKSRDRPPQPAISQLDRDVRFDNREFLITNGLGSYCSASISGANTRRYHALLCAAETPPTSRRVHLSRVDEVLRFDGGRRYSLDTNFWHSGSVTQGYRFIQGFAAEPVPSWHYEFPEGYLIKQLVMIPGQQQLVIGYSWIAREPTNEFTLGPEIDVKFIVNNRDFHTETKGSDSWKFEQEVQKKFVRLKAFADADELVISWDGGRYVRDDVWYWGYDWPRERERGLNDSEDCYLAGTLRSIVPHNKSLSVMATISAPRERTKGHEKAVLIEDAVAAAWARNKSFLFNVADSNDATVRALALASAAFVVERKSTAGKSIIAGYHWFNDWGRDTMISLPGATLATKRFDDARSILQTFGDYLSEGMLPNNFPDTGQTPAYNTSDATLWWAWALYKFYRATGDLVFVAQQLPLLEQVIEWHVTGTRYNLHVDPADGLVTGGDTTVQLTWMDAKCGDFVVTPRTGKCVEINALWYNFVMTVDYFFRELNASREEGDPPIMPQTNYKRLAEMIAKGFQKFWLEDKRYLCDVILDDETLDESVRCNQIFAASLPFRALTPEQCEDVIAIVESDLLTPMGLRTLSPHNKDYQGRYGQGLASADQYHRDITYHQGTVWPWLFGAYADALVLHRGQNKETLALISERLSELRKHITQDACLGNVSEIFDGDAPFQAHGCIAQAWSVCELLRIHSEYSGIINPAKATLDAVGV
jgi:predicted glycogen debranching enzyme